MKLLIDMNLSPLWKGFLEHHGHQVVHWSTVGSPRAPDHEILKWARDNGYIILSHDLDFSAILATTKGKGPSVVQVRAHDIIPAGTGDIVQETLNRYEAELREGALVVIDEARQRIRLLPLKND